MKCDVASTLLLSRRRGTLDPETTAAVDLHLATCAGCRHADAADAELSRSLERLPRRTAPRRLTQALEARHGAGPRRRGVGRMVAAAFVGAAIAAAIAFFAETRGRSQMLYAEAVNDHLRVLYSEHPLEVASGGAHQVKPWFSGRLEFAPVVAFGGDDDFPLQGGAVGYFIDRKAAVYAFKRRLHTITLFVFPAAGLTFPVPTTAVGRARGAVDTQRGFHVVLWRADDLGYALVSDVDERDLLELGARIAGP